MICVHNLYWNWYDIIMEQLSKGDYMSVLLDEKNIATAIYTVNRHAKTALDNKPLYELKKVNN